jgi:hypothetical protein
MATTAGALFRFGLDIAGVFEREGYDDLLLLNGHHITGTGRWTSSLVVIHSIRKQTRHRRGFGRAIRVVRCNRDFSGDTISDLVVGYAGAPWIQSTFSIYLGDTIMNTEPDHTVYVNSYFESTRLNGDYNHDGYDDLFMIGGPGIISLMLGSSDFSDSLFAFPIEVNNINVRSFFYSRLCGGIF